MAVRKTAPKPSEASRELFVGPAGCGKSEKLLQIFEERLAAENPLEPHSFFIVPSREHAERVIKRLITRGSAGFFSQRVTTLDELIEQTFEVPNPAASNLTRIAVMRRLVAEDCGAYFEKVKSKPGFLGLALDLISELKDFCWTPEDFRREMARLKKLEPAAAVKYEALAALYERYNQALAEMGLRDRRDTLFLYRSASKAKPLHFHTLCLDGFFDFTPLQMECVKELAGAAQFFSAALTWDAARAPSVEPVTVTKKMFEGLGFKVTALGKELPRFQNDDLEHVSRELFKPEPKARKFAGGIDWFEAPDPETEAEMIARRILQWVGEKKGRPGDIAVLIRSVRQRRAVFEAVFKRFDIPVEVHERERLSESEWIQTAARLARIFRDGWKKEDWSGFLRSSFVTAVQGAAKEEKVLYTLENWSWKKGLRAGLENWQKTFEDEKDAALEPVRKWFEFFAKAEKEWRGAKTAAEWARFFKKLISREFGMTQFLTDEEADWGVEAAAPGRFEKILEELENAFERDPKKTAGFDHFTDDFLRLVELDLFSLPHLNLNAVQIYDVSLARQKEYEVVFAAGLAEKQFPIQIREDALLSDWERRLIQKKPYGLNERKQRQQLEKYLFYLAVTRSRRHLCLSHARRDEEGKPVLPSFYLEEISALFQPGIPKTVKKDTQPYPGFDEVLTKEDLKHATVGALFNPWENPKPAEKLISALLPAAWNDVSALSDLRKALAAGEARLSDAKILARDAFRPAAPSPTRLEAYAKCGFRYFSERILKLKETEEDTRARVQGTIMHGVLEDFFKGAWQAVPAADLEKWVDTALDKWMGQETLDLGPHQTALARLEMKNILLRFIAAEKERLETSKFMPRYFEWALEQDGKPVEIEYDGIKINFKGYVDRLDVDAEGKHAVVSDYKRSHTFRMQELEDGIALQLPLYLLAAKKILGLEPAGGQLLNLKEGKVSGFHSEYAQVKKPLSRKEFDEILSRAMRYSKRYLEELAAGQIAIEPRECMKGCGFTAICRIEKWKLPEIKESIRERDKKLGF